MKNKNKIYIRIFKFSDGTTEKVEGTGGQIVNYTGKWARAKFKKDKILEIKDEVK